MKKVVLGGIAIGAATLLLKKVLESKAEKEGYFGLGDMLAQKGFDLFESVEAKCQDYAAKVDDWLEKSDFSTLDKIDTILGGKISGVLEGFSSLLDMAMSLFDKGVLSSSWLDSLSKTGYALEALALSKTGDSSYEKARANFSQSLAQLESQESNKATSNEQELDESETSMQAFNERLASFESKLDTLLSSLAK